MIKQLMANMFGTVYIQLWGDRIKVIDVKTTNEFDESPFIAMAKNSNGQMVINAVGQSAKSLQSVAGVEVSNPFSHPRSLIANFAQAQAILQYAFRKIFNGAILAPSPRVVIQPMEKLEGGLTEVEIRAFRELCLGAGAREVVVYLGNPLTTHNFNFEQLKKTGL